LRRFVLDGNREGIEDEHEHDDEHDKPQFQRSYVPGSAERQLGIMAT
jgi:hypothetical protein